MCRLWEWMIDNTGLYPTTAPSGGHPAGFQSVFRHRFLSFSSSLHLPLLPSPPPVSASVFLLLVLVFHLSLLLPTTQGGSYLFSKLLHKKWRGGEVGTLDSRGMEQQLRGRALTWSNPWTACSIASMKVKASFSTQLWETRGQILNSGKRCPQEQHHFSSLTVMTAKERNTGCLNCRTPGKGRQLSKY